MGKKTKNIHICYTSACTRQNGNIKPVEVGFNVVRWIDSQMSFFFFFFEAAMVYITDLFLRRNFPCSAFFVKHQLLNDGANEKKLKWGNRKQTTLVLSIH
jgi:hypothetical protein